MNRQSSKTTSNTTRTKQPIRVGIRGIAGMLGRRLALDIEANPDMEVTFGAVKNDRSLTYLSGVMATVSEHTRRRLDGHVYMEEKKHVVQEANARGQERFTPLDQLPPLDELCDVLVDTTRRPPGTRNVFDERYPSFKGAVLLQSGEYPRGRLISPPMIEQENSRTLQEPNIYRQGDCILSGTVPVLSAIMPLTNRVRLNVVMQLDEPLNTFPTQQNVVGMYPRPGAAARIESQLQTLFRSYDIEMDSVTQIPSHDYYTATITAAVSPDITREDVRHALEHTPRVQILPNHIQSTPDIDQSIREPAQMLGRRVSPIMIYGAFLETRRCAHENTVRIQLAIYSRMAAVLPNIDAIRILGRGTPPEEAMRRTDGHMGIGG